MTRLRILIRMEGADASELKARALNNDSRLKEAGISALKLVGDKKYIINGGFSSEHPFEDSGKPKVEPIRKRLRVVLRMPGEDAYELKAGALKDDPRLKDAGIAALKFVGEERYISGGAFSPDLPSLRSEKDTAIDKKVRVTLRIPRKDAYKLIVRHLNDDPELIKARISGVGMVPVGKATPVPPRKKTRGLARFATAAFILGFIGVIGAGALYISNPSARKAPQIPVLGEPTDTDTPVPPTGTPASTSTETHPPTDTLVPTSTKTLPPTATYTALPTATELICQSPSEVIVTADNLSCRYGPGGVYLYKIGLIKRNVVDVLGKADTADGTWIDVQTKGRNPVGCWIKADPRYVEIPQGDVACLESVYPEKAPLILFNTDRFPRPSDVGATRSGDKVYIQWQGYDLPLGDQPDSSRRYLTETWTCQFGEIVFSALAWDDPNAVVQDEGGCDEASYGFVYMTHVDGYIGPVSIPWPP